MTPTSSHIERAERLLLRWRYGGDERSGADIATAILRDHYLALEADGWQMVRTKELALLRERSDKLLQQPYGTNITTYAPKPPGEGQ